MPSLELDAAYLGQEFELLAVGGGLRLRVRVVATAAAETWAQTLAAGSESGGTSPELTAGDELRVLSGTGQTVGAISTDGEMLVEGRNDGTRGRDLELYAGNGPPGDGGRVVIQPGNANIPNSPGTVDVFSANGNLRIRVSDTGLGFFNTGPVAQPVIVGARGGNVALTNLLSGLGNLGIIRDNTTP